MKIKVEFKDEQQDLLYFEIESESKKIGKVTKTYLSIFSSIYDESHVEMNSIRAGGYLTFIDIPYSVKKFQIKYPIEKITVLEY